jgi:hypothetical protein
MLLASAGTGSPLTGKRSLGTKRIEGFSFLIFKEKFRGGERACVIVKGDHKPVVDLGVYIYDEKDRLVAEDKGGGEYVAAIWYPPRDAVYKVKIHNTGTDFNDCYISLK